MGQLDDLRWELERGSVSPLALLVLLEALDTNDCGILPGISLEWDLEALFNSGSGTSWRGELRGWCWGTLV